MSRGAGRVLLLWTAGFLVVLALGLIPTPPQAKLYPDFWANSPAPNGTKGFYDLLAKQDIPVVLWKLPVQMLPTDSSPSLMIMVEPSDPFEDKDLERWITWIEKGNTLWLLLDDPDFALLFASSLANHKETQADLTKEELSLEGATVNEVKGFEALAGVYSLAVKTPRRLWTETTDQVLLADDQGVIAFARQYSSGELIVCQGAAWMQNQHILQGDHLGVLLAFTEGGGFQRIWFNEYIHGQVAGRAFWGAFPLWLLALAAAVCLWTVFELWRRGMRFGKGSIPRAARIRLSDERILSLAAWYEQKEFYAESLAIQADFLRQGLFERWGIAAANDLPRLENILRGKLKQREIDLCLEVYQMISLNRASSWPETLSQRDFVAWSRRLSLLQRVVEKQKI